MMDQLHLEQLEKFIDAHFDEFLGDWKTLIKIPSLKTAPDGEMVFGSGCGKALDVMLSMAAKEGFATQNLDYRCGYTEYGEGKETVAVIAHLDVVPFGGGWTHDPLGAEEENGRLYGRGSGDNKIACISSLYALKALKQSGLPLARKVRIIFGCDEESGMDDMRYYLEKEPEPELAISPDASYPVNHAEKGIMRGQYDFTLKNSTVLLELQGGERCNVVPGEVTALLDFPADRLPKDLEDVTFESKNGGVLLTAHGKTCHAASPEKGKNGIGLMAKALVRILPETDGAYAPLKVIADKIGISRYGERLGIAVQDKATGPLTFNIGVITFSKDIIRFLYDIRNPATLDCGETAAKLRESLHAEGFREIQREINPPMFLPVDHPLVRTVGNVYNTLTMQNLSPTTMGGGTYARMFKNAVATGIADMENIHTAEESVDIQSAKKGCLILAATLYELANL